MDALALTPGEERELADLRRLAYGPAGGIDARQIARLEQLEAVNRPRSPAAAAVDTSGGQAPAESHAKNLGAAHHREPARIAVVGRIESEPSREGLGRDPASVSRLRALLTRRWFVAVVAVTSVIVIIGVVTQIGGPPSDLALDRVAVEGSRAREGQAGYLRSFGLDLDGVEQFEEHRSLSVWAAPARDNRRCLVIEAGDYGVLGVSCTPRGLDPSVDVMIWLGMPSDIVDDLPNGSVIRFVLSGDHVLVWEQASDADL